MKYIKVDWKHDSKEYPVTIYSEISDDGYENRKVEVFPDGRSEYADKNTSLQNKTVLGDQPVPSFEEINKNPEFELAEIAKDEFENIIKNALSHGN
jgi:hypothetical protein